MSLATINNIYIQIYSWLFKVTENLFYSTNVSTFIIIFALHFQIYFCDYLPIRSATCSCLQGKECCDHSSSSQNPDPTPNRNEGCCHFRIWGRLIKSLVEGCGGLVLFTSTLGCLCLLVWTLIEIYKRDPEDADFEIITETCLSKLWSFLHWFLYTLPYFSFKYPEDRRTFFSKMEKRKPYLRPPLTTQSALFHDSQVEMISVI